jgi:cold shock protein
MKGTIARLKKESGYGFIAPENGEKDVFFHAREVKGVAFDDLKEGDVVTFEVTSTPRGPAATNVARA